MSEEEVLVLSLRGGNGRISNNQMAQVERLLGSLQESRQRAQMAEQSAALASQQVAEQQAAVQHAAAQRAAMEQQAAAQHAAAHGLASKRCKEPRSRHRR